MMWIFMIGKVNINYIIVQNRVINIKNNKSTQFIQKILNPIPEKLKIK